MQQVAKAFGDAALTYDLHAQVQMQCAQNLCAFIEANTRDLPAGPILEVGCGTGLVSTRLVDLFGSESCIITDVAPAMLSCCRTRLQGSSATLQILDIEAIEESNKYAGIVAAFVLQWMDDLDSALDKLCNALVPGGKFFFSVPADGSFPEWKSACRQAGVTFTANRLPDATLFRDFARTRDGMRLSLYEENFPVRYTGMSDFFDSLKSIGAGTSTTAAKLSITEGRRLLATRQAEPQGFVATYRVLFGCLERKRN